MKKITVVIGIIAVILIAVTFYVVKQNSQEADNTANANSALRYGELPSENEAPDDCYRRYNEQFPGVFRSGEMDCLETDQAKCPCWAADKNICVPQRHCI
ncbi:MAG: hypothetical protein WCV50_01925 [Patescibacteria group bacterium]|jgi:hypothetical protein